MLLIHLMAVQGSMLRISLTLFFLPPNHHSVIGGILEKTPKSQCPQIRPLYLTHLTDTMATSVSNKADSQRE